VSLYREWQATKKLFRLIPKGLILPAEQWQSCVHFPAETCSAGSDILQNNVPAGHETPLNKVLRGRDPAEQSPAGYQTRGTTFKYKYFWEFNTEFKNILGCEFRDCMGSICRKNQRSKILRYCPLK
jgi:hypothetical protein